MVNKIVRNNRRSWANFSSQSILVRGIMQRYRSCDATFILNELPLRSTSAHGILISGYAHASHGKTRQLKVQILPENPCINAFVIITYYYTFLFLFLFLSFTKILFVTT